MVVDGQFAMRINGRKQVLKPANPQMVASMLQHPEKRQPLPPPPDPADDVPREPRVKPPAAPDRASRRPAQGPLRPSRSVSLEEFPQGADARGHQFALLGSCVQQRFL